MGDLIFTPASVSLTFESFRVYRSYAGSGTRIYVDVYVDGKHQSYEGSTIREVAVQIAKAMGVSMNDLKQLNKLRDEITEYVEAIPARLVDDERKTRPDA